MIIKKTLTSHQQSLVILTALSVISLLFGMTFNLYGYLIKVAAVQENSNRDSTATNSTNNNTIQLSVQEKSEVYKWLNSTSVKKWSENIYWHRASFALYRIYRYHYVTIRDKEEEDATANSVASICLHFKNLKLKSGQEHVLTCASTS